MTGRVFSFIDGGLEPGERREVETLNSGSFSVGFRALFNAAQEHPDAILSIEITDAQGADKKSILNAEPLSSREEWELERLRKQHNDE